MAMNLHDYRLNRKGQKLKKPIPRLLKRKLDDSTNTEDIVGYLYYVGYETSDWDLPNIDNDHFEEEKKVFNGIEVVDSVHSSDYIGSFAKAWSPRLDTAYIEVYIRKGDKQETIRIEEKDDKSIISGQFEQLHQWLSNLMEQRSKKNKKRLSDMRYSNEDAVVKNLLNDYNMFVCGEHLMVCYAQLDTPASEFHDAMMEHPGVSLCENTDGSVKTKDLKYKANLPVFGPCNVYVDVPRQELTIGHVRIVTERKVSEQEMLPMLEYMKQSLPVVPHFDDHGYHGVKPAPHEIELVWEMAQGNIDVHWDGFRYDLDNVPQGDGYDYVRIVLWDGTLIRRSRDEEYWRSEVD